MNLSRIALPLALTCLPACDTIDNLSRRPQAVAADAFEGEITEFIDECEHGDFDGEASLNSVRQAVQNSVLLADCNVVRLSELRCEDGNLTLLDDEGRVMNPVRNAVPDSWYGAYRSYGYAEGRAQTAYFVSCEE